MARPHVVAHVAVTVDGATTGFAPAVGRFYQLAATWSEDVTLAGADTILAQEPALREAPRRHAPAGAPLLAVVDGKGRVREWEALGAVGHWPGLLGHEIGVTEGAPAFLRQMRHHRSHDLHQDVRSLAERKPHVGGEVIGFARALDGLLQGV